VGPLAGQVADQRAAVAEAAHEVCRGGPARLFADTELVVRQLGRGHALQAHGNSCDLDRVAVNSIGAAGELARRRMHEPGAESHDQCGDKREV
jgi:hypothetical protein